MAHRSPHRTRTLPPGDLARELAHPQAPLDLIRAHLARAPVSPPLSVYSSSSSSTPSSPEVASGPTIANVLMRSQAMPLASPTSNALANPPLASPEMSSSISTMFESSEDVTFEGGTFLNTGGHLNYIPADHTGLPAHQEQNGPVRNEAYMFKGLKRSVFRRTAGDFILSAGGLDYYAPPPTLPPATTSNSEASDSEPLP